MSGLPRAVRLRHRTDFQAIQRAGSKRQFAYLVVCYRRSSAEFPRFGLTVSRRVGNAVIRNRVKRWLREAIRAERGELGAVDVVFIARTRAATAGAARLRAEVRRALDWVQSDGEACA